MFAVRSPYLNWDVVPATLVTFADILVNSPAGKKKPTVGLTISSTNAVTSFDAAAPITKAMAKPMTAKVFRKSKNSCINDLDNGTTASESLSLLN